MGGQAVTETADKNSRAWIWCLTAFGMLPLSLVMWLSGLQGTWRDSPAAGTEWQQPFWVVIWLLILCVRLGRRKP